MPEPVVPTRRALFATALLPLGLGRAPAALRHPAPALPLVVLDPGHGGKDPGAIGISGTYEKHVAFATAQELQRQLMIGKRCRASLTRSGDVFIPLRDRVAIAQGRGAVLFVSMHADSVGDPSVQGASVYTLAETASDAQTAALARRENSADRFGGPRFQNLPAPVADILSSLVREETSAGSARLARQVVAAFDRQIGLLARPDRHASFAVLRAADIPSILVEMGFMSNYKDEAALKRPEYRVRIAAALRHSIEGTLAQSARGAHIAAG